jgi:lipopolysaccharide/colanic/teichoic acid biosynthesis glycosyltransferase
MGAVVQAGLPVLGGTGDLRALIQDHGVDVVLIPAQASSHAQVLAAVEATLGTPAEVVMSPDVFTVLSTGATIVPLPGMPVVMLSKLRLDWGERLVKGLVDRLGALALLVLLSPLLLVLALIARLSCGGVFEGHTALGVGGTPFTALKFRTTRRDGTPESDEALALRRQKGLPVRDDPRLTPAGRVLRRTSLDELPQLWNVLRGQMSLVGPYKIAPQDLPHYGPRWLSVVTLKPGITGMAQVHGRGELTLEERSILDAEYVRAYSLWRDAALLLATIPAALRGRGAF